MIRKGAETEKPKNKVRPGVIKPVEIRVFDPYSTGFFIYVSFLSYIARVYRREYHAEP